MICVNRENTRRDFDPPPCPLDVGGRLAAYWPDPVRRVSVRSFAVLGHFPGADGRQVYRVALAGEEWRYRARFDVHAVIELAESWFDLPEGPTSRASLRYLSRRSDAFDLACRQQVAIEPSMTLAAWLELLEATSADSFAGHPGVGNVPSVEEVSA